MFSKPAAVPTRTQKLVELSTSGPGSALTAKEY